MLFHQQASIIFKKEVSNSEKDKKRSFIIMSKMIDLKKKMEFMEKDEQSEEEKIHEEK